MEYILLAATFMTIVVREIWSVARALWSAFVEIWAVWLFVAELSLFLATAWNPGERFEFNADVIPGIVGLVAGLVIATVWLAIAQPWRVATWNVKEGIGFLILVNLFVIAPILLGAVFKMAP